MKKINDLWDIIQEKGTIKVTMLEQISQIPRSSLLRYLKKLEMQGKVVKFYGEVAMRKSSIESHALPRLNSSKKAKMQIAQQAAATINDGDVIFIDAGSTTYYLALALLTKHITIYTNNLILANIINDTYQPVVYFLPGKVNSKTLSLASAETVLSLQSIKFDKCFIGTNSYDDQHFFTTNQEEAIVKKNAIQATSKQGSFVLGRAAKAFENAKFAFATRHNITLITEKGGTT